MSRSRIGRHHTRLREVDDLYRALHRHDCFKRFIMGIFLPLGSGLPKVKMRDQQGGFLLKVHGTDGAQEFRVYTTDREAGRKRIVEAVRSLGMDLA